MEADSMSNTAAVGALLKAKYLDTAVAVGSTAARMRLKRTCPTETRFFVSASHHLQLFEIQRKEQSVTSSNKQICRVLSLNSAVPFKSCVQQLLA